MENMQTGDTMVIRPVTTEGGGCQRHYVDRTAEYETIFAIMELTYSITNDAPKHGREGQRINVKL